MLVMRLPIQFIKRLKSTRVEFVKVGLVPNVIGAAPQCKLECKFDKLITLGRVYKPNFFKNQPGFISWSSMGCSNLYTIMIIDPDYPSQEDPSQRSWLHWLVVNMKGDKMHKGFHIAQYIPPIPICATGYHRILFLVYSQKKMINPGKMTVLSNSSFKGRKGFSVLKFIEKNCLVPIPEAGTFVYTEYDPSVRYELRRLKFGTAHEEWVSNREESGC